MKEVLNMAERKTKKETAPKKETTAAVKKQAPAKAAIGEQPAAKKEARVGVFICHCGTNIAGSIDIPALQEYAKTIPSVAYVDNYQYMCSTPGQGKIEKAIARTETHRYRRRCMLTTSPRTDVQDSNQGRWPEPVPVRDGKHPRAELVGPHA